MLADQVHAAGRTEDEGLRAPWVELVKTIADGGYRHRSQNLCMSILPPETIAATFPGPACPLTAAATAHAAAPSARTRARSATSRMAEAASSSLTTITPSTSL